VRFLIVAAAGYARERRLGLIGLRRVGERGLGRGVRGKHGDVGQGELLLDEGALLQVVLGEVEVGAHQVIVLDGAGQPHLKAVEGDDAELVDEQDDFDGARTEE